MATITASMVKELRERTGAGMMECKKALVETGGDIDAAIELMRKQGMAKADKKAGRVAAEGMISVCSSEDGARIALVEVNSETDFVAKGDDFRNFAEAVCKTVLAHDPETVEALLALPIEGGEGSVDEARRALIAKIGENITVRRFVVVEAAGRQVGVYLHGNRIGVVTVLEGGDETLAKDIAMHVAASKPLCVSKEEIPAEVLAKEKEIYSAQAKESGKPENIIEKMVEGRLRKFVNEVTLLGQPFVKNPDQTVEQLLKEKGARVREFHRLEVGEGVEKKQENFAEEVMSQVKGS